ncbi:MAG: hypothetical protein Fur0039_03160 [Rhodocyclaceae bacterium]
MNLPAALFPWQWQAIAWLAFALVLAWLLMRAPWRRLAAPGQFNVWAGAVVVLALLWSMKAGVRPGLDLHLIGAMVLTLAFGPALALAALFATLAAVTANGAAPWAGYALNATVMCVVPVALAHALFRATERLLPQHFFVYIFVCAFFGSALSVAAVGLAASLLLWAAGAYAWQYLLADYLPFYVLLGFSEAWLSGMAVTLLVVYRPAWVATFDDARYLLNK